MNEDRTVAAPAAPTIDQSAAAAQLDEDDGRLHPHAESGCTDGHRLYDTVKSDWCVDQACFRSLGGSGSICQPRLLQQICTRRLEVAC